MKAFTFAVVFLFALTGCAAHEQSRPVTTRNSELTHGNVQLNLEIGKTTQAEVLEVFGAPNIATIDSKGDEVWSYQRAATAEQSASNSAAWTLLLVGGGESVSGFERTSRMITLIIKFDNESKIVSEFRSRSSDF